MTTTAEVGGARTPWRHWLIAVLSLLWNGFGGFDYTMSHLQGEAYYRQMGMPEAQITAMAAYPAWMHAVWAIGVWGSVLGSILLLLRSRWAVHAFAVSTLGAVGSLTYIAVTPAVQAMGLAMPAVIVVICIFFVWYAQLMAKRGVLR